LKNKKKAKESEASFFLFVGMFSFKRKNDSSTNAQPILGERQKLKP